MNTFTMGVLVLIVWNTLRVHNIGQKVNPTTVDPR